MVDVLIIDDIQFLSGKGGYAGDVFSYIQPLAPTQKQIVLTSDKAPVDIQDIQESSLSF